MNNTQPPPELDLLDFSPNELLQHYPNLPSWAVDAFQSLQGPSKTWTPEARALLNMAQLPLPGVPLEGQSQDGGTSSEDGDLWRLSRDLNVAKNAGWKQSEGRVNATCAG